MFQRDSPTVPLISLATDSPTVPLIHVATDVDGPFTVHILQQTKFSTTSKSLIQYTSLSGNYKRGNTRR